MSDDLSPANVFDLPHLVPTTQVKRAVEICRAARLNHSISVIVGLPGIGKTWAVQYAAQRTIRGVEPGASPVLYTTVDVENTARAFVRNLLTCLGPDYRVSVSDAGRLVGCWIHRRMTELFIIDEADRLDSASLEIIRDLHERTRCGFVLVGQLPFATKIRRHNAFANRVGVTLELESLTYDGLIEFLGQWLSERQSRYEDATMHLRVLTENAAALAHECYRVTQGNIRRTIQLIQEAERIGGVNGDGVVSASAFKTAIHFLSQAWYGTL
jgi:DNA transposition AAA+ family ATPase